MRYELAREFQVQALLDETLEIIDDPSGYLVERVQANGRVVVVWDRKQLPRCRLRMRGPHVGSGPVAAFEVWRSALRGSRNKIGIRMKPRRHDLAGLQPE